MDHNFRISNRIAKSDPGPTHPRQISNLAELVCRRAEQWDHKRLFCFVRSDNGKQETLTYRGLHQRAMAVAGRLQAQSKIGDRVWLMFPPGLDFISAFFGCLFAGVVAVPVSPLRRRRPASSLAAIFHSSEPVAVLSTSDHCGRARDLYKPIPELLNLPWIATDEKEINANAWVDPHPGGQQLAMLQYTSGSTALPKGVMLSHENLLHNSALIQRAFNTSPESRAVFWLPFHHDMGLVGGIIQPLFCGGSCTLLAPTAFLHRPLLWLETISNTRATVSGGPNFAYDLCARKIHRFERKRLDLSCWETAFTGSEPIWARTLDRFYAAFGDCGFRKEAFLPCYGLAEATLMVTGGPRGRQPEVIDLDAEALALNRVMAADGSQGSSRRVVGCGEVPPGIQVVIADPETRAPCTPGQVGEIWVRSPSVAQGYFKQQQVKAVFGARLAGSDEGPFLCTGDLGFLHHDRLFVTGRLKDLIIIRGRNFYPEDIEQTVQQASDGLRAGYCAAFCIEVQERECLVILQEIEPRQRDLDMDAALRQIRLAVAENFDLEVYAIALVKAGTVLKTSSGKTRRSACRERYLAGRLNVLAQWTTDQLDDNVETAAPGVDPAHKTVTTRQIEEWMAKRIAAHLNVDPKRIPMATPFVEFRIGSLESAQIASDLERWLGRNISPTAIYNHPSIRDLACWLARPTPGTEKSLTPSMPPRPPAQEDPERLRREIQELSQKEIEAFLKREMTNQ